MGDEVNEAFRRDGFAVVGPVAEPNELRRLHDAVDRHLGNLAATTPDAVIDLVAPGRGTGPVRLPQLMEPERLIPELTAVPLRARARAIAASLLGLPPDDLSHFSHLISKPALDGPATPWHQDEAYWDPAFSYEGVSVWIPLDDAPVETGSMCFIPGSHHGEVRVHRHIDDDRDVHGLMTDAVDPADAVRCPISIGDATVHHCRALHASGPNMTDRTRHAYIHVFSSSTARAHPLDRPWLDPSRTTSPVTGSGQR
jgi:ectoine hydroxylase-related dioxygenase (phytanoyl-CoA dioxygenase family)